MKYATALLAAASAALAQQFPIRLGGVNTAGYDFTVTTNGSFSGTGATPPSYEYAHFSSEGANLYRIPFAWQLMTPTLGGAINESFFEQYDTTVQYALNSSTDSYIIVDLHNYARWDGGIIAQGGPTNEQYASIWTQLAEKYGTNDRLIFGLMNEPHDLDIPTWVDSVQYVVSAIRGTGATNYLLLPGSNYTSAQTFPTGAGPLLAEVTDPLYGNTDKLIFDVHKYLDYDNSGTHAECVTNNTVVMEDLVTFLLQYGGRQAILSETGGGNTASCEEYLYEELAYVKSAYPNMVGFSVWAAGAFDTTYILTVTPNANGTDQPLWIDAVRPNLPPPV
ncbi:Manganese dependent endoglucanase Eg5A [Sparassis crispa]|uniref:cellulase n=1 Tax=Sparassis crispa TaxID=139825 RepID=A0A401G6M5_9APHY|nr:Manganese dependent endoglucanase Eg5A [Sparassis crispa]GBE77813.1 Manganese dependent endoglucanase Eg5A [Sparassis crispa]